MRRKGLFAPYSALLPHCDATKIRRILVRFSLRFVFRLGSRAERCIGRPFLQFAAAPARPKVAPPALLDANVRKKCLDIFSASIGCLIPHLVSGIG